MTSATSLMYRDIRRFSLRVVVFAVALLLCHAGIVAVAIRLVPDRELSFTNIPRAGEIGQAKLMIDDAARAGQVDLLFLGSSHAYQSFDPRFFAKRGLRAFTLGSSGQSPAQGYYLQRRFLRSMRPRLVVYEVWWNSLAGDGEEATLNLTANLPLSLDLVRMNLATRNVFVYGGLVRRIVGGAKSDPERHVPSVAWGQYVGNGYVEAPAEYTGAFNRPPLSISIRTRQLGYLERMVREARDQGAKAVLVVQPLPRELLDKIQNYPEIDATMRRFATRIGVPYVDFNRLMGLETRVHFADSNHLNAAGVEVFLSRLMEEFQRLGLLHQATGAGSGSRGGD